jgi:hypothetical protein
MGDPARPRAGGSAALPLPRDPPASQSGTSQKGRRNFLWRAEGCSEGQAERHWQTAETVFDPSANASASKPTSRRFVGRYRPSRRKRH